MCLFKEKNWFRLQWIINNAVIFLLFKIGNSESSDEPSDEDELLFREELREQEQRALQDLDIAAVSTLK